MLSLTRSRWAAIGAAVAVTLGGGGLIGVSANGGSTAVLVPVNPVRILDTRSESTVGGLDAEGNSAPYRLKVAGAANSGVPSSGVTAVSMNLTAVETRSNNYGGFVTAYPCATSSASERPYASSLNFVSGQTVANAVVVPLSSDGYLCLYVYGVAHLIVDVNGYYTDLSGSVDAYTRGEVDGLLGGLVHEDDILVSAIDASGVEHELYVVNELDLIGLRRATIFDSLAGLGVSADGVFWDIFPGGLSVWGVGYLLFTSPGCVGPAYASVPLWGDGFLFDLDVISIRGSTTTGLALTFDSNGEGGLPPGKRRVGLDESDRLDIDETYASYINPEGTCVNGQLPSRSDAAYRLIDLGPPPDVPGPIEFKLSE